MIEELVWMCKMHGEFREGVRAFAKKSFGDEWREKVCGLLKQKMKVS